MPRSLAIAGGILVLAAGVAGLLAGYLDAADEPPARGASASPVPTQGGALAFGVVRATAPDIVVEADDGSELRFPAATTRVLAGGAATFDDVAPGDTVTLALETTAYGGQAVRLVIVTKAGS